MMVLYLKLLLIARIMMLVIVRLLSMSIITMTNF